MAGLTLAQSIELARTLIRMEQPLDEVLANPAIPEEFRGEVRAAVTPTVLDVPELATALAFRSGPPASRCVVYFSKFLRLFGTVVDGSRCRPTCS